MKLVTVLKSKIHRIQVTHADKEYEGSCAIDANILEMANIREYEQIHIYNVSNGERFITYAMKAEPGSKIVSVNGAAAWKANPGDIVIICTYASIHESDPHKPIMVYCTVNNTVTHISRDIPVQVS
jgi:aspartate 1-decarboxylase